MLRNEYPAQSENQQIENPMNDFKDKVLPTAYANEDPSLRIEEEKKGGAVNGLIEMTVPDA